ncbi:MAG: DUF6377 domain-containing protein [Proteiniphilum sp.]|uniref:DUF6377 domain-containing protein n=1 Tax=Proteiniphilum sp. TaxID=1926877 RepID=UPI000926599D|nr:DUF6377 domain-containing protein [Proteiniphilum sp.]MEA5127567.1 DUF6377 domain-containing protein [Proteiniphilum sp.]OJV88013.1 MAG: hypothetical protein BGO34_13570 [Bacteroidia bacterium 44-10]
MRHAFIIFLLIFFPISIFGIEDETDSLLTVLDKVISERSGYAEIRENKIQELKQRKQLLRDTHDIININREIIDQYNSFICDSAEFYIKENLSLAYKLNDQDIIVENMLRLSYIYSLSGLFIEASNLFDSLDYKNLSDNDKLSYCWNYIRYFESLIFYTYDSNHSQLYEEKKESYRDTVMSLLDEDSEEYKKELAHKLQQKGQFSEAEKLLLPVFHNQTPGTHDYAMAAMNMAKLYRHSGEKELENYYLIIAAITDIELAVKENEALLSLAVNLYDKGDIDRAYEYIRVALDDALFYNARFKNSVIARVQPIIEDTYLQKIYSQQKNLKNFSIVTSLFALMLIITLFYLYLQVKAVSKARKKLRIMNEDLLQLNRKLDEANTVKEHYIGYFMNQCSIYVNKLHKYRKNVNLNIKTGQINNLFKLSTDELEKDISELHANFDKAFLALYPDFVSEFNSLLRPEEQYYLERGQLNNELRIYALIKLGITDMKQIADFLHYSVQTVYNYKSKVKGKALMGGDQFEKTIIRIGSIS